MTSTRIGFSKAFSLFSMTLLQETGWYEVDMRFPDSLTFGYLAGCNFLEYACTSDNVENFNDFCPVEDEIVCTPDFSSKGQCKMTDPFSDVLNQFKIIEL